MRGAALVAVLGLVAAGCATPAAPTAPTATIAPEPTAPAAPEASASTAGSPAVEREAAAFASRVCVVNGTTSAIDVQRASNVGFTKEPSGSRWESVGPGMQSCASGSNSCDRWYEATVNADTQMTSTRHDTCGYVRVADAGLTFVYLGHHPGAGSPSLTVVDQDLEYSRPSGGGGTSMSLNVLETMSTTLRGVKITGKRLADSAGHQQLTITVSR